MPALTMYSLALDTIYFPDAIPQTRVGVFAVPDKVFLLSTPLYLAVKLFSPVLGLESDPFLFKSCKVFF